MKALKSLDARHKAAARMRIEGKPNEYICAELGVQKRTLHAWMSDDLMKEYLQDMATNIEVEFAEKLASAGMVAVSTLVGILEKPDADTDASNHQKLEVAQELLDRLPATARVRERRSEDEPDSPSSFTQIFANMDNNQLAGFLQGGWRELAAGNGDLKKQ